MPIAAVDPNITYAKPLEISSEPVNNFLREREQSRRDAIALQGIAARRQTAQDRLAAQQQKDIEGRMKYVENLGKQDIGGMWQSEQEADIQKYQNTLSAMIKNNDPNWQEYAIKAAGALEGNRLKSVAYDNLLKQNMATYGKNKAVDPAGFQKYWIGKTAYDQNGKLIPLDQLDLQNVQKFNPQVDPDFDSVLNTDELAHEAVSSFKPNTVTLSNTNRENGVTQGYTRTITAPEYTHVNPVTGTVSVDKEKVENDPVLKNHIFDHFRGATGNVSLVKEPIYQQMMQNPNVAGRVARTIIRLNAGKKQGDKGYIDPTGKEAQLIGRAVATNLAANQVHGNFSLRTTRGVNEGAGKPDKVTKNTIGLAEKLKGAMDQDPQFLQNGANSKLPEDPLTGGKMGNIVDLTSTFKDLNVSSDVKRNADGTVVGKTPVPAKAVVVKKDHPGSIFIYTADGKPPQEVKKSQIGEWVNSKIPLNKNLDAVKWNEAFNKVFGTDNTEEPESTTETEKPKPASPLKNMVKAVKDTVTNWASFKRK